MSTITNSISLSDSKSNTAKNGGNTPSNDSDCTKPGDTGPTQKTKLQAALQFAAKGWGIIPVNGKFPPYIKNWQHKATSDRDQIHEWWKEWPDANIGFVPETAGICVVDEDTDKGGHWPHSAEHRVKTPHGRHFYYQGSLPPTVGKLGEHIDTRGRASYVLLPGSDGYEWETEEPTEAWECDGLPAGTIEACNSKAEPRKATVELTPNRIDRPSAIKLFKQYLAAHQIPPEGEGSDEATYRAIAKGRDLGVTDTTIVELIGAATDFDPEWLDEKLGHVAEYQQNEFGADIPETGEEKWGGFAANVVSLGDYRPQPPVSDDIGTRERRKWVFRSPEEDANQPPLTYFDDHRCKSMLPRLPGGCALVVVGRRSSHKSGMVIKECLDAVFNKGACIVYFAPEGANGIKTARLAAACKQRGKTLADLAGHWFTFDKAPGLMSETEIADFIEAAKAMGIKPDIIVIDTLTRAAGAVDISAPGVGIGLILGMERFAAAFDATVIAVTHPGKDATRGSIGSSLVESLAFALWKVSHENGVVSVYVDKMKDGPAEFTVPLKIESDEKGVPVVVEMSPGERAKLIVHNGKEGAYRRILGRRSAYEEFKKGLSDADLAAELTHDVGEAEDWQYNPAILVKEDAGKDGFAGWATEFDRQLTAVRNARKEAWSKPITDKQVPFGGTVAEWRWFLPSIETTEAPDDEDGQVRL